MESNMFLDSENYILEGKEMIYFKHSNNLVYNINDAIKDFGAKAIFSSPKKDIKVIRESIAEYFFISALKKDTGKDWFIMQPQNDPPDFWLMTFDKNLITLDPFELVEIPEHFSKFDEMFGVVNKKINKRYSERYNLLIFVNNKSSNNWVELLHKNLGEYFPFKTVWTIKLLSGKDNQNISKFVINRIRPFPIKNIITSFDDEIIFRYADIPDFMEEKIFNGKTFLSLKKDFVKDLTKEMRRWILDNKIRLRNEK
ncbi:MAG: hypothetical protein ABIG87_01800 [Patescibacteria group bacterium]